MSTSCRDPLPGWEHVGSNKFMIYKPACAHKTSKRVIIAGMKTPEQTPTMIASKKITTALSKWDPKHLNKALSSPAGGAAAQELDFSFVIQQAVNALEKCQKDEKADKENDKHSEIAQRVLCVKQCVEIILEHRQVNSASLGAIKEEELQWLVGYGFSKIALALIPCVHFSSALNDPRLENQAITAACWACMPDTPMQDSVRVEVLASIFAHAPPEYIRCAGFGGMILDDGMNDNYTPLFIAARLGNPTILAAVLSHERLGQGILANERSSQGLSAMSFAARSGSCESLQILLNAGHPVASCDDEGRSALCHSVIQANFEAAELLLSAGALLVKSDDGLTVFDRACSHLCGSSSKVKSEALAFLGSLAGRFGASRRSSAIDRALVKSFEKMSGAGDSFAPYCREIVNLIEPSRFAMARDFNGETLVMLLARHATSSAYGVEEFGLIKELVDINELSPKGESALGIAIGKRNLALALAMLEHGASLQPPEEQTQLLFELAASGGSDSKSWLSAFCPDADFKAQKKGFGPLCTAARHANATVVALLIDKCRGERARDGTPALSCACVGSQESRGRSSAITCIGLLWSPEDAAYKSRSNSTPLIQAANSMPSWMLKDALPLLMRAPLDLDSATIYGDSARGLIERECPEALPVFDELALARSEEDEIAKQTKMPEKLKKDAGKRL